MFCFPQLHKKKFRSRDKTNVSLWMNTNSSLKQCFEKFSECLRSAITLNSLQ